MRRRFALVAGLLAALASPGIAAADPPTPECAATACELPPRAWEDPARWGRLREGMSRFDVFRLLGEPGKVSVYDGFERWEYPAALGARVNFDDRGRVASWWPRRAAGRR
jgi:outer membrane protein assembly factor BamE (lipoprotein component of BamABCDE complex)